MKTLLLDPTDRDCLEKEPKILQLLFGHPSILHLFKVYKDDTYLHLVSELCPSGTTSSPGSPPAHCQRPRPDNILFDARGKLKLADFGSAKWFSLNCESRKMEGIVVTPYYVALEVLRGRDYNEKVDVWSAGVILYIMLSGVPPFYGETPSKTFESVLRGEYEVFPEIVQVHFA